MHDTADVVVIGAGVIGLLTAMELAARDASVVVVERDRVGRASSRAGGGILAPIPPWQAAAPVDALAAASLPLFPQLAARLAESTGIDVEYRQCGALLVGVTATAEIAGWAKSRGWSAEELTAAELSQLEPQLAANWQQSLLLRQVGQLRNPRLMEALHKHVVERGVTVLEQQPVTGLLQSGSRIEGVTTSDGKIAAAKVVVAGGAWTSRLLGEHDVAGITPVRGQMLWYRMRPGDFRRIVIEGDRYLIPRLDGVCLIGSTVEQAGFDAGVTASAGADLARFAASLSPLFSRLAPAGQWSGLRPGRHDGIPVICAHPQLTGLYINAGHYRNGINLAPASARLCAALVTGGTPRLDPGPYAAHDRLYSGHDWN
ncbi:MAG: glycine oxidase ThiO [Gammaproteobacteria bacterium]|nr:glycine oxidase ThiO [Gammaproteobacteria bacterium]NNM20318.1 glycine oxidase ThiO [Gammaproteobacteria bacterium]